MMKSSLHRGAVMTLHRQESRTTDATLKGRYILPTLADSHDENIVGNFQKFKKVSKKAE
jgi:hypothetical protein